MKTILISALAAMALGACASQTGLGNTVSGGAYGELSPDWEKASKAEAKAQNLIDKGEARIEKGEKKIKDARKMTRDGEDLVDKGQADIKKGEKDLADAKAKREAVEADYKSRTDAIDG